MPPAARAFADRVMQMTPHCHAPIHPPAPTPTPVPHPGLPLTILVGFPKMLIGGMPAARVTTMTTPCMMVACVPAGPGMIVMGSFKVLLGGLPAARMGDMTLHPTCIAPIPCPTGTIMPPCCPKVMFN